MAKLWSIVFGVVLAAAFGLFVIAPLVDWWLPPDISTTGGGIDGLNLLILFMTGFAFVLTMALMVWFLWKYVADPKRKAVYTHGNHKLEVFWTIVVSVLLLLVAFVQIPVWAKIKYQNEMPIPDQVFEVSARQFEWRIRHPSRSTMDEMIVAWQDKGQEPESAHSWERMPHSDDIHVVNEIHTWRGAKVRLYLKTRDVLHSFFLPNLRIKQDALPGKTIPVWFETTQANIVWDPERKEFKPYGSIWDPNKDNGKDMPKGGWNRKMEEWDLACAELCGWGHGRMQGRLFVHDTYTDYLIWLEQAQERENARQPSERDKPKPKMD